MAKIPEPKNTVPDPSTLNPQNATEYLERGWLYYTHQNLEKAISDFQTALEKEPNNIEVLYALGLALKASGATQQALKIFIRIDEVINYVDDRQRRTMISRLTHGQINQIRTGDWNLEKEVWEKRP